MIVPNLIVPGFPKSGTSSLHEYLNKHPEIQMSRIKEPHIYSNPEYYNKRKDEDFIWNLDSLYQTNYSPKYFGESSTSYMINYDTPPLLFKENPKTKFILLVRDPIERIISHYNWLNSFDKVSLKPFREEVNTDLSNKFDITFLPTKFGYKSYVEHSLYGKQLQRYLEYFPIEQFLFISTQELKKNHQKTLNKCFKFLGLKTLSKIPKIETNKTSIVPPITKNYFINKLRKVLPLQTVKNLRQNSWYKKLKSHQIQKVTYQLNEDDMNWLISLTREDTLLFEKLTNAKYNNWITNTHAIN